MEAKIYTQELLDPAVVLEESFPETPAGRCIYLERGKKMLKAGVNTKHKINVIIYDWYIFYSAIDGSSFINIVTYPTAKEKQGLLKRRKTEFDLSRTTDALRRFEGEEDEEDDGKTVTKWTECPQELQKSYWSGLLVHTLMAFII